MDSWWECDGREKKSLIDGKERVDRGIEWSVKTLLDVEYVANNFPVDCTISGSKARSTLCEIQTAIEHDDEVSRRPSSNAL
jgi:hypothetical protein